MKKLVIATVISLSIGVIKSEGTGGVRKVRERHSQAFQLEALAVQDHKHVEDGVYVKPGYALDLFDELYD